MVFYKNKNFPLNEIAFTENTKHERNTKQKTRKNGEEKKPYWFLIRFRAAADFY